MSAATSKGKAGISWDGVPVTAEAAGVGTAAVGSAAVEEAVVAAAGCLAGEVGVVADDAAAGDKDKLATEVVAVEEYDREGKAVNAALAEESSRRR